MVSSLSFGSPGLLTIEYSIFLSSADDFLNERDLFRELIDEINEALIQNHKSIRLLLKEWTTLPGFRSRTTVNKVIIREKLAGAHLLVSLLGFELKPGTREELDYALNNDMEMCLIVLSETLSPSAEKYLKRLMVKENIYVVNIKRIRKSPPSLLLRSVLTRTLSVMHQKPNAPYVEERGVLQ